MKPLTVIAIGGGAALATLAFVAGYLYMDSPAEDEQIAEITQPKRPGAPNVTPRPGDPTPTQVADGDYELRADGLKIHDMVVGTGDSPTAGQIVKVHYSGWLADGGRMFDSSVAKGGDPIQFVIGKPGVIPGWQKGIEDMKVGGKRQLVIPPELAYGKGGRRPVIPPNSTLIFDVELVGLGDIRVAPEPPDVDFDADSRTVTLDEGVQAIDLVVGDGAEAVPRAITNAEISVWNPKGEQFYSSRDQPKPMHFMVDGMGAEGPPLKGLNIGLKGMKEGGVRLLRLPPETAFGPRPQPPVIEANSVVLARIDLVDIEEVRTIPTKIVRFDRGAMTTTDSGLMYTDVVVGDGAQPSKGDLVSAEYSGWLEDGTLFDSSYKRASSLDFPLGVGRVIPAWDEAIAGMKVGGTRIIVAPPEIAYGDRGQNKIPPNATLIFEIKLIAAKSSPQ